MKRKGSNPVAPTTKPLQKSGLTVFRNRITLEGMGRASLLTEQINFFGIEPQRGSILLASKK